MRTTAFVVLIAGAAWAAPATFAQAPPARSKPQAVPFTLLPSKHMTVRATVNGKGPYTFVFDTGAPINIVSSTVGKAAGISNSPFAGGLGLLLSGPTTAKIDALTVGDVTAKKVPAMVMDHPTVGVISDAFQKDVGPIHGIIGFPFFARYAMAIDYQKQQLLLTPNGYEPADYLEDVVDRLTAAAAEKGKPKVVAPAGLWGLSVAKPAGDTAPGVVVTAVVDGGPAAKAGLRTGDRLLTLDGRWTDSPADVVAAVSLAKPGRPAAVTVARDGAERTLEVTPANGL